MMNATHETTGCEYGCDTFVNADSCCASCNEKKRIAQIARDPQAFAKLFGLKITGRTANGYRSRRA